MSRAKDKWVCTYHAAIFAVINYLQRIDSCTLRSENIKYGIYNKTVAKNDFKFFSNFMKFFGNVSFTEIQK